MRHYRLKMGFRVQALTWEELSDEMERRLNQARHLHICTLNPEIVEYCTRDAEYKRCVEASDIRTIDGIGISLAVLARYRQFPKRFTGVQFVKHMALYSRRYHRELCVVGGSVMSRTRAEEFFRQSGAIVRKGTSPDVSPIGETQKEINNLPEYGVVLVALGAPKQDRLIRRLIESGAPPNVYVGVGGAIDYLSGVARIPPTIISRIGLEWLYRLLREPKKRIGRQAAALPKFFLREILAPHLSQSSATIR